jgi:L-aminopeptidase/D-esterase-like protein
LIYDGDTVFSLATGRGPEGDESIVGALAADALAAAIVAGVREATSVPDYPALRDM